MWHSLGKVTVTNAGTPVQATQNQTNPAARFPCQSVVFEVWPANLGKIYICDRANAVKATGVGVLAILAAPSANNYPSAGVGVPSAPAALNAGDLWIDADNSGEGVLVSAVRA
jgi:hypothetical protein